MAKSKEKSVLLAEFHGLIGETIDGIKEKWQYQYPEMKSILNTIQEAINAYQGSPEFNIPLPGDIQGRSETLRKDLEEDLAYISTGYKHIYEVLKTYNKEARESFNRELDNFFKKEVLKDIDRQQVLIKDLAKLFQDDDKQEYNKQLGVLVDEDFAKQKPIEILAKILSDLPQDGEEYKKLLHDFVDIELKLHHTEPKLFQFFSDIKKYEKQLENFSGTEEQLQEIQLKLQGLSKEHDKLSQDQIKLKHEQINVVHSYEDFGKKQIQREYEFGMRFLFNDQLQQDKQNFSEYKLSLFTKQRDELAANHIVQLEKIEKQMHLIAGALEAAKQGKDYDEQRPLVSENIIRANEIGLVDSEMLAIFSEYIDPDQQGIDRVHNMRTIFSIARNLYPYPQNIDIINQIGPAKVSDVVQDGIVQIMELGQATFEDLIDADHQELAKLHSKRIVEDNYQFLDYIISENLPNTFGRIIERGRLLDKDLTKKDLELIYAILTEDHGMVDEAIKEKIALGTQFNMRMSQLLIRFISFSAINTVHVQEILKMADINAQDDIGRTPLYMAAMRGLTDIVNMLLDKGTDPNIQDSILNYTPLHSAVSGGKLEVVKALTSNSRVDLNKQDSYGGTPLHVAAATPQDTGNSGRMTRILLEAGANSQIKNKEGYTPLVQAVIARNIEVVMFYIKHDTAIGNSHEEALFCAINPKDNIHKANIVRAFIENGTNLNFQDPSSYVKLQNISILESIQKSPIYSANLSAWIKNYGENGQTKGEKIDRFTKKLLELKSAQYKCKKEVQVFIEGTCNILELERAKHLEENFKPGEGSALYKLLIEKPTDEIVQMFNAESTGMYAASSSLPGNDRVETTPTELQDFLSNTPLEIWDKLFLVGKEPALRRLDNEMQDLMKKDNQLSEIFQGESYAEVHHTMEKFAVLGVSVPSNIFNLFHAQSLPDNSPNQELAIKMLLAYEKGRQICNIKHNLEFGENIKEVITTFRNLSPNSNNKDLQAVAKTIREILSIAEVKRTIGQGLIRERVDNPITPTAILSNKGQSHVLR